MFLYLLGILVLFGADRISKVYFATTLAEESLVVIPGVLNFTYVENTGAAFGVLKNATWLLALLSFVLSAFLILLLVKRWFTARSAQIAIMLIVAGGLGNLYDRVVLGYVIDFIQAAFISFPVFNLADCYVTIGTALFCVYLVLWDDRILREPAQTKLAARAQDEAPDGGDDGN